MSISLTDMAKNPGLPLQKLEAMLDDIAYQPQWRPLADRADEYYDCNQLEPHVMAAMKERGQPILIHNLIAPAIDGVLGMQAKTRSDWKVTADDDLGLEVAEGLNEKMHEAARLSRAHRACSDAFAAQAKSGLAWVEVNKVSDPFKYKFRCKYVHRREIFWDWHAEDPGLEDARWLLRRKWVDKDELYFAFPNQKDLIDYLAKGWRGTSNWGDLEALTQSDTLMGAYQTEKTTQLALDEWWDSKRERSMVYEVYYRVWEQKPVLRLVDGTAILFNKQNPVHVAAVAGGKAIVSIAPYTRMKLAYFIGPHRVLDIDSPHPHNKFPYVPFWGYRESLSGAPYGLIRRMIPAQDEVNYRRSKLTWILNKIIVTKDDDALLDMTDDQLMDELFSGDSVITLNSSRRNKDAGAFNIQEGGNISSQQFTVMQEAEKLIQDTAGIYSAFLGQEGGAKSGVAIDSLVERGNMTLGELFDNFSYAQQLVGELLLANIVEDIGNREMDVKINKDSTKQTKVVRLNAREFDGESEVITNRVTQVKARVVLEEVQNTPGYRRQLAERMLATISGLPEAYRAAFADMYIEMADIPQEMRTELKKQVAQITGTGLDPEEMTEEQKAAMQRKQVLQQKIEELNLGELEFKVQKLAAEARKLNAQSTEIEGKVPLDEAKTLEEIKHIRAKIKEIVSNVAQARQEMVPVVQDELKRYSSQNSK